MRELHIRNPLGAGAFGAVYLADMVGQRGFRRTVAVKVLNAPTSPESEMFISRIRDEARLLGLLEDDCILKVIGLIRIENRDAVLMEYIDGVDFSSLLERERPPPRALAELGAILAGTLHRAHTSRHPETGEHLRVVHRDVKPANVMLTASGGVKLLDFGVAKAAFDSRESRTGQLFLGTLHYMAHDYILTGEVSPALDIYGLGLTLLEASIGQPFGSPRLTRAKFESRLEELLEKIPDEAATLRDVLARVLHWDPDARGDARAAEQALLRISDDLGGYGLRRWCGQAIPRVRDGRPPAEDTLGLVGTMLNIADDTLDEPSAHPAPFGERAPSTQEVAVAPPPCAPPGADRRCAGPR